MDAPGDFNLNLCRMKEMLGIARVVLIDDHLLVADHPACARPLATDTGSYVSELLPVRSPV